MNLKKKWIAGLILVGVLLVGLAFGSAGTLFVLKKKIGDRPPSSFAMKHERIIHKAMARMEELLDLTPEQAELIEPEMIKMSKSFRSLHEKTFAEMEKIAKQGKTAVFKHLTEEQIEIYEKDLADRHFRMRRGPSRDGMHDKKWHEHGDHKSKKFRAHENVDDFLPPPPPPPDDEG